MTGERTDFRLHPRTLIDRIAYLEDKIAEAIAVQSAAREEGRRQGWAEAIAAMSNRAAVAAWMREHDGGPDAYLADRAPKEETHG